MLQIHSLQKSYGSTTVLSNVQFLVNNGEHVGLISPNGSGKTTLLRCIVGLERPDSGAITLSPGLRLGYLPQAFDALLGRTVGAALDAAQADLVAAEQALDAAAAVLANQPASTGALAEYDAALARFEALGGYTRSYQAATVLEGLGLGGIAPDTAVATLSGGQKTRLALAALLLGEPDLLLLDEPTNHLDTQALLWLEGFVQSYRGAALIVSHDRAFLDRTTTRTLYLDPATHTVRSYAGNYSAFAAARAHEHALHEEAWQTQQAYITKVESDIVRLKGQALGVEGRSTPNDRDAKFALDNKGGAKKVAKKAKSRERKLERYLADGERVSKPQQPWGLKLDFGVPPEGGRAVLRVDAVAFTYPGAFAPLFRDLSFEVGYGERLALTGPNGAGKTTLLRLIAGQFAPTSGTLRLGAGVRVGLMAQEQETLDPQQTVLDTVLRARPLEHGAARAFLHQFLFGGERVFDKVGACSLGERSRLQLALLVLAGCNLLLLDEPLNHLDIAGREHFEQALDAFAGSVIAVSHDRAFLANWPERTIAIANGRATEY